MSSEDDPILRDYARIAGERPCEEITRSLLSEYGIDEQAMGDEDAERRWEEQEDTAQAKTKADFAHIYNSDGTCHAANCGAPGLILAYDEFSPEIALWFCGMHWNDCTAKEMLTVAEDKRRSMASLFGGTYMVRESSPGVFTHVWSVAGMPMCKQALTSNQVSLTLESFDRSVARMWEQGARPDMLMVSPYIAEHWEEINHRAQSETARSRQRQTARQRAQQRDRARTRRQHRAAFRRRKAGLA